MREIAARTHRVPVPMHLREKYGKHYIDVVAKDVLALPQPMGGLRLASDSSNAYDLSEDGVGSMMKDPGYLTFDWFVIEALTPRLELCGAFYGGVSRLLRLVSSQLSFDHGVGMKKFGTVETALVSGVLNLGYKSIDMTPYGAVANNAAVAIVNVFLQAFDSVEAKVSHLYVCGGGASFYSEALRQRLPGFTVQVMPEGVISNCRGFWLAGNDRLS